jgi:hypothetical protein
MRGAVLAGLLGVALLASSPARGATAPRALDQPLAADLEDVPLARALAVIARRLGLRLENRDAAEPAALRQAQGGLSPSADGPKPARITAKLPPVSAEVLLLIFAWETDREALPAPGLLRWGPPQELPAAELAKYRRERTLRLEHKASLLYRRLSEPLRFRLKVEDVPLADLLHFLQRECSLPLFLDPRAAEELSAPGRGEFADLSLTELLDRLLPGERAPASGTAAGAGARQPDAGAAAHQPLRPDEKEKGAPGSTGSPGPLGWVVVGDLVVVSTPAHLYNLRRLIQ